MIYQYCELGPLKDYLQGQAANITLELQEQLFRFGLDIAKGMEFLASKKVDKRSTTVPFTIPQSLSLHK